MQRLLYTEYIRADFYQSDIQYNYELFTVSLHSSLLIQNLHDLRKGKL